MLREYKLYYMLSQGPRASCHAHSYFHLCIHAIRKIQSSKTEILRTTSDTFCIHGTLREYKLQFLLPQSPTASVTHIPFSTLRSYYNQNYRQNGQILKTAATSPKDQEGTEITKQLSSALPTTAALAKCSDAHAPRLLLKNAVCSAKSPSGYALKITWTYLGRHCRAGLTFRVY
jgi:hypothetical protein